MNTKREEVCEVCEVCGRVPVRWDPDSIATGECWRAEEPDLRCYELGYEREKEMGARLTALAKSLYESRSAAEEKLAAVTTRLPVLANLIIRALENHSVWPCSKCKTLVDELRALAPNQQPNETEKRHG